MWSKDGSETSPDWKASILQGHKLPESYSTRIKSSEHRRPSMNSVWYLTVLLFAALCVSCAQDKYTTRYDNIDVDNILKSNRLLNSYINCVLTGNSCTPEGKLLRELLPDALQTDCAKCSDVQKKQAGKVLGYLLQFKRPEFDKLIAKFDPQDTFRKRYGFLDEDEDYVEEN